MADTTRTATITLNLPDSLPIVAKGDAFRPKRSLWRSWKQLSRFQRSLLYMCGVFLILFLVYFYILNPSHGQTSSPARSPKQPLQNNDKLIEKIINEVDDRPDERAKNKVERVIDRINPQVDEEHNQAKEEGANEPDNHQDSNGAQETFVDTLVFRGPTNPRQEAVVKAFKHAWTGYKTYSWGHDHLRPISKSAQNWFGLGLTIVDSLDTMIIMGLNDEFEEAAEWVDKKLNFDINKDVNLFETTIRVLGGLLSAYHLSGKTVFMEKAKDLGDRLLGAFGSPSGIPYADVNLKSTRGHAPKWSPDSSTSEVTTIQLEFRDLSRISGNPVYEEAAAKISETVHDQPKDHGLVPIFINANTGKFRKYATITLGARGDSYYEYLLKQWIQTGKTIDYLKEDFEEAVDGIESKLAKQSEPNKLTFIGEILSGGKDFKPKMDELACFFPGTLALGVHHGMNPHHLQLAEEVAYTCYMTFARQPTHLAPEITHFNYEKGSVNDMYVKPNDAHYLLRPETVESLWYLYYFTGNKTYQDWGWKIFQGIEKYTKVPHGYTTIGNVRNALDLKPRDMMESFFLGETLKYFYLLFSDRKEFDLDKWVFNTEAHPLPVRRD